MGYAGAVLVLTACGSRPPATATQSGPDDLAWVGELVRRMGDEGADRNQVAAYLGRPTGADPVRHDTLVAPFSPYLKDVRVGEPWPGDALKTLRVDATFGPGGRPSRDAAEDLFGDLRSSGAAVGSGPAGPVAVRADSLTVDRVMRKRDVRVRFDVGVDDPDHAERILIESNLHWEAPAAGTR